MKNLKKFRQAFGYTQEQLAAMLKTTQQTVARWESGKAEPNIAALRDLAVIFGTGVDDILGRNPLSDSAATTSLFSLDEGQGNFWGHLSILLPGDKKSRWFPISVGEAKKVRAAMVNHSSSEQWFWVSTLNNRLLVINGSRVKMLGLLDDAADEPYDDWEIGWDDYVGYPLEVYRGLANWSVSEERGFEEFEASDTFMKVLEDIIKEKELTPALVRERVLETVLHFTDGSETRIDVDEGCLGNIIFELDCEQPAMFDLSNMDDGFERFVPATNLRLIDMPLHLAMDGAKKHLSELESDQEC